MLFTYDGIVVGRREIGDNSCFIDILTEEQGIIEATAHGAKKINSPLLSSAALFAYSKFCLSKNKLRYTVNSAKPIFSFHEIGADIEKLALASYFAQAIRFCTPQEQTQDSIVRFLAIALYETKNAHRLETVRSAFELRLSAMLGYTPDLRACCNCGCYEHNEMFFLPNRGEIFCGDCFDREYKGHYFVLPTDTLAAMRNILYAPLDRSFRFNIAGDAAAVLSRVTESYFLARTERSFPALEYYKGIRLPNNIDSI